MADAAKIHKLESELQSLNKEVTKLRDQNRRGDAELQKAVAILNKSKEAQHLSLVMDERDTYQQQVSR